MRAFQGTFAVDIWSIKCCVVDIWSIFGFFFWWSIFDKTPVAGLITDFWWICCGVPKVITPPTHPQKSDNFLPKNDHSSSIRLNFNLVHLLSLSLSAFAPYSQFALTLPSVNKWVIFGWLYSMQCKLKYNNKIPFANLECGRLRGWVKKQNKGWLELCE